MKKGLVSDINTIIQFIREQIKEKLRIKNA